MAFCPNCGAQTSEGAGFCPSCGKEIGKNQQQTNAQTDGFGQQATEQNGGYQQGQPGAEGYYADADDIEKNKGMAVLSYFGLLVLIPIFTAKESKFAKFHANQGLILLIASAIISVIAIIPVIGWILALSSIAIFVFTIMGIVNAASGKMKETPLIGKFKILN